MRAADSGTCPQHPIAGRQQLEVNHALQPNGTSLRQSKQRHIARTMSSRLGEKNESHPGLWPGRWRRRCDVRPRSIARRRESNYPNRPIHVVVPYPAGGIVDIVARAVTEQVGRDWKQPIVVGSKARRQQQYRHRAGRAKRSRRLHLAGHGAGGAGQSHAVQGRRLGPDEGLQMRRPRDLEPERGGRQSGDAGQDARRIRRARRAANPASSISAIPAPARRST